MSTLFDEVIIIFPEPGRQPLGLAGSRCAKSRIRPEAFFLKKILMVVEPLNLLVGGVDETLRTGIPSCSLISGFFCESTCSGFCFSSKHIKRG